MYYGEEDLFHIECVLIYIFMAFTGWRTARSFGSLRAKSIR